MPCLWPVACLSDVPSGPALVRRASFRRVALRAPVGFPFAVVPSNTGRFAPPDTLGGCTGLVQAGQKPSSWCLPLDSAAAGALGSLCIVPIRCPAVVLSLAGPSGVSLGLRALRWFGVFGPGHSRVRFCVPSVF